jgi:hypothetical protein
LPGASVSSGRETEYVVLCPEVFLPIVASFGTVIAALELFVDLSITVTITVLPLPGVTVADSFFVPTNVMVGFVSPLLLNAASTAPCRDV